MHTCRSFSRSPSINRAAGIPVARATTSAMCAGVTCSSSMPALAPSDVSPPTCTDDRFYRFNTDHAVFQIGLHSSAGPERAARTPGGQVWT